MPEIQRFDARKPLDWDLVWKHFDEDGGLIVEHFLEPELLGRLRDDFAPLISTHAAGSTTPGFWADFHGDVTKRITGLPNHSDAWIELLQDPRYRAMGDRYLGEHEYWLNTGQLICIGPDETPQLLHRDELNWPQAVRDVEITVTAIFALTDFTAANGATVIAPGSNRWEAIPDPIHGGGANTTADEWRVGLHAGFCRGWLRAEENYQLTVPLERARELPDDVQYLLGFRSYTPAFGARLGPVDYDDAARLVEGEGAA